MSERARAVQLMLGLAIHTGACGGDGSAVPDGSEPQTFEATWAESTVTRAPAGDVAVLAAVRFARHDGYDRFVLEFEEHLPGYRIRYPAGTLHQCGSGLPVEIEAPAALQIELRRTAAHDADGAVTVSERELSAGLPVLRDARLTCDYEGIVEWVLGLEGRAPFRVLTLRAPPRVVVDLRHP